MTRNKSGLGLVNGSMAVAKSAAKVKNIMRTRHFMKSVADIESSEQVLSASQSPFPVGSQYTASTFLYNVAGLSTNAIEWVQKHDKYRISQVEVFVTLNARSRNGSVDRSVPVEVFFYEDTDADPATATSWIRVQDRDNLGRVVLNALTPSQRILTFKPTLTFAAGAVDQNPANVVPKKDTWLDALAIQQLYSGLRVFSCCPQTDSSGQSYEYALTFQTRITIEAMQPL